MSTTKHTAAPWISEPIDPIEYKGVLKGFSAHEPDGSVIFIAAKESDAKLISAAPEMIELLKHVMNLSDRITFPTEDELKHVAARCKNVIKKATL